MAHPQTHVRTQPLVTIEQYLEMERPSEERHEYLDGYVYAMAGESPEHADICTDLILLLGNQLGDGPCRIRSKDTKIRSGPRPKSRRFTKGLFSYPDLVVICGEPQYLDEYRDVILNPTVIIEVLSEATEKFDRGAKFLRYQNWNPALSDYLLVWQDQPVIEHFVRQLDGTWRYSAHQGLEQGLKIESIACALPLERVYRRVTFTAAEPEEDGDS